MTDFFNKEETPVEPEEQVEQKIKVGEEEFSQEELSKIVGLGKIGLEAEEKFNTKLDRVYPEYTKKTQRVAELEKENESLRASQVKPEPTNPEWNEESKAQAKKALHDLFGDELMTKKEAQEFYANQRAATQLLEDVEVVINEANAIGKPKTSVGDLLQHMDETGIKNPEKAYKDMFEDEIDKWKFEQAKKLKPAPFQTQTESSAGAKEPSEVHPTNENLKALLREHFQNAG